MTLVNCDYCGGTGVCPNEEHEPVDCGICECTGCVEKELDVCVCADREPFECYCGFDGNIDFEELCG